MPEIPAAGDNLLLFSLASVGTGGRRVSEGAHGCRGAGGQGTDRRMAQEEEDSGGDHGAVLQLHGRAGNRNPHPHFVVSEGGIDKDKQWRDVNFFDLSAYGTHRQNSWRLRCEVIREGKK